MWDVSRSLLVFFAVVQTCVAAGLPEVAAPFAPSKSGRSAAVLKVPNVNEAASRPGPRSRPSPTFVSGNKAVVTNGLDRFLGFLPGERFVVDVDGQELAWGQFWGMVKGVGGGAPFKGRPGSEPQLSFDAANRSVTYSKEYCLGASDFAVFSWTLKALADGKVRLSWDLGVVGDSLKGMSFGMQLFFEKRYRSLGVALDGKPLTLMTAQEQRDLKTDKELAKLPGPGNVAVAPGAPTAGFALLVDKGCEIVVSEGMNLRRDAGQLIVYVTPRPLAPTGSVVLDLGEAALAAADAPPPRAGVDFWAADRMEMPPPTTRNLVPNPSFEQGLRYWNWWFAGTINYSHSDTPCYELVSDARFGRRALRTNGTRGNKEAMSFPIPVEMGKTYTLSFYAKAERPATPFVLGLGFWPPPEQLRWTADKEWTRYAYTFTKSAGRPFVQLCFQGSGVTIDGLQLEEGRQATEFTAPAVEGRLVTADPDNCLQAGGPFNAALELSGKPGLSGDVAVTVSNYYREQVFVGKYPFVLDKDGAARVALPLDPKLDKGVFVVRVEYQAPGQATLVDQYRFSVLDFLENRHATREFFGNHMPGKTTRNDDLEKMLVRWGWGARHGAVTPNHGMLPDIPYYCALIEAMLSVDQQKRLYGDDYQDYAWHGAPKFRVRLDALTTKEALVEQLSYEVAKAHPELKSWSWSSETDGRSSWVRADNYAEHAKLLRAMRRGVKRAIPDAIVLPDGGPAHMEAPGWEKQLDAFLSPVTTLDSFKWDAVAIHPYMYPDDVDGRTVQLLDIMRKHGYGKETPIYYTEGGNTTDTWIPAWSSAGWYDDYPNGRPSYDSGWQEFKKAAWDARRYLVGLKYWPQIQFVSIWTAYPYFDMNFAPIMDCAAVNTLGHLFGNPKFVADIAPVEGVKGLAFEDEQGRGLAAVWSTGNKGDVERGVKSAPKLRAKFGADSPEFIDLMGNVREAKPVDGVYEIPLSPAPLFIRGAKGSAAALAAALNAAAVVGAGAVIKLDLKPDVDGKLVATLSNKTARELQGVLGFGKERFPFKVPASGDCPVALGKGLPTAPGAVRGLKGVLDISLSDGSSTTDERSLAWFHVPHAAKPLPLNPSSAEWLVVPAIPLTNWAPSGGKPGDLDAKFQLAWDKDNLYLRVAAEDDHFRTDPEQWKSLPLVERARRLYDFDGCVEVYFDTFADGQAKRSGYDNNDCRYDFYANDGAAADGPGRVWRQEKVFSQLAGGLTFPTDAEVSKDVKCEFRRDGGKYSYVMIFPARYLQPFELVRGQVAGFGLDIHDKEPGDLDRPQKKLSLSTEPGESCWSRPDRWPLMILGD